MDKQTAGELAAEFAREHTMDLQLQAAGLTRPYYLDKIKELCEATKTVSCVGGKDAGSGSIDFVDVPDYPVQLNAVKVVIDLYGDKAPTKTDVKFPDKDGNPQEIGGLFTDMERANRLVFLMETAAKRVEADKPKAEPKPKAKPKAKKVVAKCSKAPRKK